MNTKNELALAGAKLRNCEKQMLNPKLYEGMLRMKVLIMAEIGALNRMLYSKNLVCNECKLPVKKLVQGTCPECIQDIMDDYLVLNGVKE